MNYKDRHLIYAFGFAFAFVFLMSMPVSADYVPPGGSGGDRIALGGSAATTMSITAPEAIADWALDPSNGVNTCTGVLTVNADGDWKVTASDQDTTTNGYMTEWDGANYITTSPKKLASPMKVSCESGGNIGTGYEVQLPDDGVIADGGATSGDKNVDITFKQPVSWTDKILADDHKYRIVVSFTISAYS